MKYELAKKLKDAKFPTPIGQFWGQGEMLPAPTLSELIEACGDGFTHLEKRYDGNGYYAMNAEQDIVGEGDTPEESVSYLWLALNKK